MEILFNQSFFSKYALHTEFKTTVSLPRPSACFVYVYIAMVTAMYTHFQFS